MFSTLILPDGARTADGQTLEAAQLMWLKIHNRRVASRFSGVSRLAAPASSCAIASAQTLPGAAVAERKKTVIRNI